MPNEFCNIHISSAVAIEFDFVSILCTLLSLAVLGAHIVSSRQTLSPHHILELTDDPG